MPFITIFERDHRVQYDGNAYHLKSIYWGGLVWVGLLEDPQGHECVAPLSALTVVDEVVYASQV